ncbi:hypothetical protein KC19_12G142900 [Ceratodon purpureus]|uniref:Uncharacterized protein n=1 Tax=Ceratodon purpureus TaxID=3225 RepID=A0A8T0G7S5_CERPU|nr:hypothetical protein KC19_12G142900 [Ceratodon purpureus]
MIRNHVLRSVTSQPKNHLQTVVSPSLRRTCVFLNLREENFFAIDATQPSEHVRDVPSLKGERK